MPCSQACSLRLHALCTTRDKRKGKELQKTVAAHQIITIDCNLIISEIKLSSSWFRCFCLASSLS
jgi:hypothetical protein